MFSFDFAFCTIIYFILYLLLLWCWIGNDFMDFEEEEESHHKHIGSLMYRHFLPVKGPSSALMPL